MTPKIAVVGCGYWGQNLVRNFAELGALGAVCDGQIDFAKKMADQYGVPALSFETILESGDIQGVVVATPAAQHALLTRRVLESGKAAFVEKPLALNLQEAMGLCTLAKQGVLMVGHLLQYHPAFHGILDLVSKGTLGKLCYLYSNRLSFGKIRTEENALWSFAPHDISMILALAGDDLPETVSATGAAYLNSHIQDVTTTHLTFKNGLQAHIFVSWLHPFKEQKLVVIGDRGMAVFDDGAPWDQKLKLYPHEIYWEKGVPSPAKAEHICIPLKPAEPLKQECQHFLDCIVEQKTPLTDGQEGLRVLRVLDASTRSLQRGQPISLKKESIGNFFMHETACVDQGCHIGRGTKIWHFSHLLKGVQIGENCTIGQNVMIGPDVRVGNHCKIQNNVSLYRGITLEDGVFCGPSCVFTNVRNPRATIERKDSFQQTYVEKGVTIGANATIVCGVRLGAYSFIGAGAVVLHDVKPHAVMVGNPAHQIGWMSHAGEKLDDRLVCPREGRRYRVRDDQSLEEILS